MMFIKIFICIVKTSELLKIPQYHDRASQVAPVVKNPPANTRDIREVGSIPGSGRSPGGAHGNPLQYS